MLQMCYIMAQLAQGFALTAGENLKGGIEQSRLVSASDRVASTLPLGHNDVSRTTA
jgi:hypothetical protein